MAIFIRDIVIRDVSRRIKCDVSRRIKLCNIVILYHEVIPRNFDYVSRKDRG